MDMRDLLPITLLIGSSVAALACSGADASFGTNPGDNARGAGAIAEAPASSALVRVANLTSDAPALDVCLRVHGADTSAPFDIGPMLRGRGLAGGLSYPEVSAYAPLPPATYDVRIVAPGANGCAASLGGMPDRLDLPAFEAGSRATLVGVGSLGKELFALDVHDDDREVNADRAKLRFVHASPAVPALDVGLGAADSFAPVFTNVAFRAVGGGDGVDANGYRDVPPFSDPSLVVRVAGRTFDTLTAPGFGVAAGNIVSLFSIGVGGSGGALLKSLLVCQDGGQSSGALSSCNVIP
jgi:hypothetical protein